MIRLSQGIIAFLLIFTLAGCAELKQLRIENAGQKARIDQLVKEIDFCQDSLKNVQGKLLQANASLGEKDALIREQKTACSTMQQEMQAELDTRQKAFDELKGKLTLTMVESILFDPGKAELKKEGVKVLKKTARALKENQDKEIIVAGYTDNSRIRGSLARVYPSNWELSMARAMTVMKVLEAEGIDPKLMSAIGYGEFHPVADNSTPEGRAKNRRMEIILMPRSVKGSSPEPASTP